ncbi:unnamed protein product [Nezara viridula]|uniref:Uncharacterized protein n=1 Tax=Nezara viridula TaxID=85310 RepID=A0A9P0E2T9_NEZVI|nr:unnamed protein product [Nezara viridula]
MVISRRKIWRVGRIRFTSVSAGKCSANFITNILFGGRLMHEEPKFKLSYLSNCVEVVSDLLTDGFSAISRTDVEEFSSNKARRTLSSRKDDLLRPRLS